VPPELRFLEHGRVVHDNFESPAARRDQFDCGMRVFLSELSRQTGGSGLVVSKRAVFDRDIHVGFLCNHRTLRAIDVER
jgi:hypothetical protein